MESLEPEKARQWAEAVATCYPLQPYPGWRFNVAWDSVVPEVKTRQSLWEYFKARQIEGKIKFNWYFDLCLYLYLGNDLSSQLFIAGCIEPNEFYFLSQILSPGMTFIDIGANEGLYTLFAAKLVGSEGQVLAFEPSQREFDRLQANLALNQVSNVQPFQLALSNTSGNQQLQIAENEHSGQNTLGEFAYAGVACAGVEMVPVRPLDEVLQEVGVRYVDVMKMDVEGAEFSVLEGARQTLERDRPLLLLELVEQALHNQGSSVAKVLNFLDSLGYKIFLFGPYTGLPIPPNHRSLEGMNVIAAHPERAWSLLSEQSQIEHLRMELSHAQTEANQFQVQLQHTQEQIEAELQQIQQQAQQQIQQQIQQQMQQQMQQRIQQQMQQQEFDQKLAEIKEELARTQTELQQNKQIKETLQALLETTRNQVAAMETSKFWQLRQRWLNLKQKIRVPFKR